MYACCLGKTAHEAVLFLLSPLLVRPFKRIALPLVILTFCRIIKQLRDYKPLNMHLKENEWVFREATITLHKFLMIMHLPGQSLRGQLEIPI